MDGLTAISRIRQAENDQSTPREERQLVMALTGNARQGQIDQAFAAGMDDGRSLPAPHLMRCASPSWIFAARYLL